jgi:hypothetical protein
MRPAVDSGVAGRLRAAFELYDLGLAMMRQNLRRRFAAESDAEIQRRLLDWRLRRSDAPDGDSEGRVVPFPRTRP